VADRRLRYPLLWLLFLGCMVAGAALLLSADGAVQAAGLALLLLPLFLLGLLTGAYYVLERWRAR
jgi:Na+/proline symporter